MPSRFQGLMLVAAVSSAVLGFVACDARKPGNSAKRVDPPAPAKSTATKSASESVSEKPKARPPVEPLAAVRRSASFELVGVEEGAGRGTFYISQDGRRVAWDGYQVNLSQLEREALHKAFEATDTNDPRALERVARALERARETGASGLIVDGKLYPRYAPARDVVFSADGRRFACIWERDTGVQRPGQGPVKGYQLVVDGQPTGKVYVPAPWVKGRLGRESRIKGENSHALRFLGGNSRVSWVAPDPAVFDGQILIEDGVEKERIPPNAMIHVPPAGGDLIWEAWAVLPIPDGGALRSVGHAGRRFGPYSWGLRQFDFQFSKDGRSAGFIAYTVPQAAPNLDIVVVNGVEIPLPPGDEARSLVLAPDGQGHVFLSSRRVDKQLHRAIHWNEREFKSTRALGVPSFSPDGKHLAFSQGPNQQKTVPARVMLDFQPWFEGGSGFEFVFSPDSRRLACKAVIQAGAQKGREFVVLDGKRSKAYNDVSHLTFSPDSQRMAYFAFRGKTLLLVLDGEEQTMPPRAVGNSIVFSPDSRHIAVTVDTGRDDTLDDICIVDGVAHPLVMNIHGLRFSPDSRHIAYVAELDRHPGSPIERWTVVVNGQAGPEFEYVPNTRPSIDEYESATAGNWLWWDAPGQLRYLGVKTGSVFVLRETIR